MGPVASSPGGLPPPGAPQVPHHKTCLTENRPCSPSGRPAVSVIEADPAKADRLLAAPGATKITPHN